MPTYPIDKTFRSGFYNNKKDSGGNDDRVYGADDLRKPYDVIYSDGIKPDLDGTAGENLKVVRNGGMQISVLPGFAKVGGAWFENTATYNITLDAPTASTRYDCVILRNDDSDDVRESTIYVKSLSSIPVRSNLERTDKVYELCLAYILVNSSTSSISDSAITDTRTDGALCNIMAGVGATVVRTYRNTYYSTSQNQQSIPIGISQYIKDQDELIVSINGVVFTEGSQYQILNNSTIKLTIPLPVVGTKVDFVVHKNVTGASNENVNQEVAQVITDVENIKKVLTHDYYCDGINDNINIGNLVKSYFTGSGYGSVRLNIHGTFGAWQPAIKGDSTDYWFDFTSNSDRTVLIDFTDCSQIVAPISSGKTNVIFYGRKINLVGVNLIVNDNTTNTAIVGFDGSAEIVNCENCRFWITGYKYSYISRTGTFTNCRGSVTNTKYYSYCFNTSGVVRIIGGEYYAYTADSTAFSAVVGQTVDEAVSIMYGVNAPTVARSGYFQTNSIKQLSGNYINCTDLVTTLELSVISGESNIRGTIPYSKPNMM